MASALGQLLHLLGQGSGRRLQCSSSCLRWSHALKGAHSHSYRHGICRRNSHRSRQKKKIDTVEEATDCIHAVFDTPGAKDGREGSAAISALCLYHTVTQFVDRATYQAAGADVPLVCVAVFGEHLQPTRQTAPHLNTQRHNNMSSLHSIGRKLGKVPRPLRNRHYGLSDECVASQYDRIHIRYIRSLRHCKEIYRGRTLRSLHSFLRCLKASKNRIYMYTDAENTASDPRWLFYSVLSISVKECGCECVCGRSTHRYAAVEGAGDAAVGALELLVVAGTIQAHLNDINITWVSGAITLIQRKR